MLVLETMATVSTVLTPCVLLVTLGYLIAVRRTLGRVLMGVGDRHIEIRIDLKNARAAHERHHKDLVHWLSKTVGDLKRIGDGVGSIEEAANTWKQTDDHRKTVEMNALPPSEESAPAKEMPPTVRGANLQGDAVQESAATDGAGDRASHVDEDTLFWREVRSGALGGLGAPRAEPASEAPEPGASMPRKRAS
jgi:hypothetical protein